MSSPGFVALLIAHSLCALLGFGALGATGWGAARAVALSDPFGDEALRRYFRPGRNLVGYALFGIPVFGALLLVVGPHADAHEAYPWIGLIIWFAVAGLATARIWPNERALQRLLADAGELQAVRDTARRCEQAVALSVVFGFGALAVMIIQP